MLRKEAWAIRGLAVPPIEPPSGVPGLLRLGAGLTWRGCAGASAYTLERAPAAHGPWVVLATGLHDSVIADVKAFEAAGTSAPVVLWYDELAATGETWHYRLRATNAAGSTPYSPVLSVTWDRTP